MGNVGLKYKGSHIYSIMLNYLSSNYNLITSCLRALVANFSIKSEITSTFSREVSQAEVYRILQ